MFIVDPCPFCGKTPTLYSELNTYSEQSFSRYFWLRCDECGIETRKFLTKITCGIDGAIVIDSDGAESAKNFWNSRYIPPEPDNDEHPIEGDDSEENLNSLDSTNP